MAFNFDEKIERRGTDCVKWDAFPEEYIPMFIADTDFAVPPAITERLIERTRHPVYGYSMPGKELFDSFIGWFKENYNYEIKEEWLVLMTGIVPALAVASGVRKGKSITNIPNYMNILNAPKRAGNEMIEVPMRNTDEFYEIDFDALKKALTPDTRTFYLCNPHNPVGRVYTEKELRAVAEFAKYHGLLVVSDEIHCELVYDRPHIPFLSLDDYARDHSITFMAPGKTYNVPGVTLSFAIIPNAELREKFKKVGYAMGHPGVFEVQAAIGAYKSSGDWKQELVAYLKGNRDYLEKEIKERFPKAKMPHTEGTFLQWIDFRGYGENIDAEYLKENAKVVVNDGADFGVPGYVRLNFGCRRETITAALDRIEEALKRKKSEMTKLSHNVLELIGGTPLLEVHKLEEKNQAKARVLVKLEFRNPGRSVKDRIAAAMLREAEEAGVLKPGATIIEPTSGNTGIGLAMAAAAKGYKLIIVMPASMSIERRKLISGYGAKIVLTPGPEGMKGAIAKAKELAEQIEGSFIPGQFVNPANPKAHYETTGVEIWNDTDGQVDVFVAGVGTGGTVTGTGKYLKEQNPKVKVVAVEPASSPVLSKGTAGAHKIQGIGAGFVPDVLDQDVIDEIITVANEDAYRRAAETAKTEGLLVGISSGAAIHAALELAKRPEYAGKTIVALLPDTGERYLSTGVFGETLTPPSLF